MPHGKTHNLPIETAVRKPRANELCKGMTVYYPVRSRAGGGDAGRIIKYRAARIRKVEDPVVRIVWLDDRKSGVETLYVNAIVVEGRPTFDDEDSTLGVADTEPPPSTYSTNRTLATFSDLHKIQELESFVAKQDSKPAQIRSVAPIIGIPRDKQQNSIQDSALIAATKNDFSTKKPVDAFDDWLKMGTEIVHPDIERDLQELQSKKEQIQKKLEEIDAQHLAHIRELEEAILRAKQEHTKDRAFADGRLKHVIDDISRLDARQRVLSELKKLM